MSHLLYLQSFEVARFVKVFGGGNEQFLARLLAQAPAASAAVVTRAVMHGLGHEDDPVRDQAVAFAMRAKEFGIAPKSISPMGAGQLLFDDFEERFESATAKKLFAILQRGRNYDGRVVLLSPEDVRVAANVLRKIARDDDDEFFQEELVQPFAATAKKGRAIFGAWG
jgi:hypothetical protein